MPEDTLSRYLNRYSYLKEDGIRKDKQLNSVNTNEDVSEDLERIFLTRKRMLDINLHKNDIKNKRIYMMFIFIILIVLAMTIIHFKNTK